MVADSLINNKITIIKGPAGTGKSHLALGFLFSLLEISLMIAGISLKPAILEALRRLSPAISSYPKIADFRTIMG